MDGRLLEVMLSYLELNADLPLVSAASGLENPKAGVL